MEMDLSGHVLLTLYYELFTTVLLKKFKALMSPNTVILILMCCHI